jgi:uncharacterized membrane protein
MSDIYSAIRSHGEIGWMAFVTFFVFILWMYQVRFLMALFLGLNASFATLHDFLVVVLTTNEGLVFLMVGNAVGAALSLVLFSLTVVSFPLLLDRDVDFVTAMITSVRAVTTSPVPMIGWAAVIVVLLAISALPFFLGLLITLPVLGHTTWHLYRISEDRHDTRRVADLIRQQPRRQARPPDRGPLRRPARPAPARRTRSACGPPRECHRSLAGCGPAA